MEACVHNTAAMTTGKKFAKRTSDDTVKKMLDHKTKSILNAVISEPRGLALSAYLKAMAAQEKETKEAVLPG